MMTQTNSKSGDECHYEITGISNGQARKVFGKHQIGRDVYICDNETCSPRLFVIDEDSSLMSSK